MVDAMMSDPVPAVSEPASDAGDEGAQGHPTSSNSDSLPPPPPTILDQDPSASSTAHPASTRAIATGATQPVIESAIDTAPAKTSDSAPTTPIDTIPQAPPTITTSIYPFVAEPTSVEFRAHARVQSSAEDWTPEGDLTNMNANSSINENSSMTVEGERTLVEDDGDHGPSGHERGQGHRKAESASSLSLPATTPGSTSATKAKGHTAKMMSQSSNGRPSISDKWDPLQRPGEASEHGHGYNGSALGHDRDRTVFVEDGEQDLGEQRLGEDDDQFLPMDSDASRKTGPSTAPDAAGRKPVTHASRRASHLRLDIQPPASPPPWETVEPPPDNNAKSIVGYYSPATSKFRTLQSAGTRSLIPKSSYYRGVPPPDSAYGTPPVGQIGVHHPREVLRIERDYTCGEITQFSPIYPLELEGRITPTHFLESVNSINELLISAHSIKRSMLDNMIAIFSLQISRLFLKSHFEKEMLRLRDMIDELNEGLYNPVGLNILYPRNVAFLYLEIEYY